VLWILVHERSLPINRGMSASLYCASRASSASPAYSTLPRPHTHLQAHTLLLLLSDSQQLHIHWLALSRQGVLAEQGFCRFNELQASLTSKSTKTQRAILVLPESRVLAVRIPVPDVAPNKIRELAPYAVEEWLAGEPDKQTVAVSNRERKGSLAGTVLAWCVERQWLQTTLAQIRNSCKDVSIERVVPESALLSQGSDSASAWQMLIRKSGGQSTDDWHGVLIAPDGSSSVSDIDPNSSDPPVAFQLALNRLGAARPQSIVVRELTRSLEAAPPWAAALVAKTQLKPLLGDSNLIDRIEASPSLLDDSVSDKSQTSWLVALAPAMKLAAAACTVHVVATVGYAMYLKQTVTQQQRNIDMQFSALFPNAQLVDPRLQTGRNLQALRQSAGQATQADLAAVLAQLERAGVSDLQSLDYNYPMSGSAKLTVTTRSEPQTAARWQQQLARYNSATITVVADPRMAPSTPGAKP
jgi:type II secretion system protein L